MENSSQHQLLKDMQALSLQQLPPSTSDSRNVSAQSEYILVDSCEDEEPVVVLHPPERPSSSSSSSYPSLFVAARQGNTELLQQAWSNGADLRIVDKHSNSLLFYAVKGCHGETVDWLVRTVTCGLHQPNQPNTHGVVCVCGSAPNKRGVSALSLAISLYDTEMKTISLHHHHTGLPSPSTGSKCIASSVLSSLTVPLLDPFAYLRLCAKYDCEPVFSRLAMNYAARLNDRQEGWTLLGLCSHYGSLCVMNWLITHARNLHIDLNKASVGGATPLHITLMRRNQAAAILLLHHGVEVDVQDDDGHTPLSVLLEGGWDKEGAVFDHLLHREPDLGMRVSQGQTVLMSAVKGGHTSAIHLILNNAAVSASSIISKAMPATVVTNMVDATDYRGNTAVLLAAAKGDMTTLSLLHKYKPRLWCLNDVSEYAMWAAVKHGHHECVWWLMQNVEDGNQGLMLRALRYLVSLERSRRPKETTIPQPLQPPHTHTHTQPSGPQPGVVMASPVPQRVTLVEHICQRLHTSHKSYEPIMKCLCSSAIRYDDICTLEVLTRKETGLWIDNLDDRKSNALMLICEYGANECLNLFMMAANKSTKVSNTVYSKDATNCTAIMRAATQGHSGIVGTVVASVDDRAKLLNMTNKEGDTVMVLARKVGAKSVQQVLAQYINVITKK